MTLDYKACGLAKTMKLIENKWTIPILFALTHGKKRFNELQTLLDISPRTLSMRLNQLELNGLVVRRPYTKNSQRVEYTLTKRGQSLNEIIIKMCEWGE